MKTYAFLIVLDFIQLVFCNRDINITDHLYPVCPIERVRAKRAYADYTRWRANQETTNEFLVKVLDDELIPPHTKPIAAVNIQSATKKNDKIIIAAIDIPTHTTTAPSTSDPGEYTRFMPPTTVSERDQVGPITPVTTETAIVLLTPPHDHSQRDDSPPAGPQFIARTPVLVARQYAPIEAVAFNRRANIIPVTPTVPAFHAFSHPTRTWPPAPIASPTRSKHDFEVIQKYEIFDEEVASDTSPDETTRLITINPKRTTEFILSKATHTDQEYEPTTKQYVKDSRKTQEPMDPDEKESDASYNMLFYNDEDSIEDKKDQDLIDSDYSIKTGKVEATDSDLPESKQGIEDNEITGTAVKELTIEVDELVIDNRTGKVKSKGIFGLPNIQATIDSDKFRNKRRPALCNLLKVRDLNFNAPRTLPEIFKQLKQWADVSPVAKWVDITNGNFTTMENPIYMMIVDDLSSGQIVSAKQTVMIVAGIQGRDHHAVTAAMYVLYQLIERSETHSDLLTKYRFWIVPVFNPDGYDYSMTFPHRREWTKNLHQSWEPCIGRDNCKACETHGLRCTITSCYGVNLDRNFEYQWIPAEELRAEHPCGNLYAGTRQLSETETRALTQYLHEKDTRLFTFIAFKEGNVLGIMYPYSHTMKKRAFDHIYRQRALSAATAAYRVSNRPYVAGQTSEFLPLYAGGIEDWIDGHLGVDNTYTIMMFRPSDSYNSKLLTEHIVHETYAAMDTLLLQSVEPLGPAPHILMARSGCSRQMISKHLLYIAIVHFILLLNG